MRILFLLLVALFISPTFAQAEDICLVEKYKEGMVFENCNEGDILLMKIKSGWVPHQSDITAHYCDYEQVVKEALAAGWWFTCVLKTKTPRKIKFIK